MLPKFCTTRKLIGSPPHDPAHIGTPVASPESNLGVNKTHVRSRAIRERPERNTLVSLGFVRDTVLDLPHLTL